VDFYNFITPCGSVERELAVDKRAENQVFSGVEIRDEYAMPAALILE
jgi:hypothetical protein